MAKNKLQKFEELKSLTNTIQPEKFDLLNDRFTLKGFWKKEFKNNYRATLNKLPVTESQVNAIVTEANYAFRLNMYMFDELDGNLFKSTMSYLCGVVKGKN